MKLSIPTLGHTSLPLGLLVLASMPLSANPSGGSILSDEEAARLNQSIREAGRGNKRLFNQAPQSGSTAVNDAEKLGQASGGSNPALSSLGNRIDGLETRAGSLESSQFSTTTKLKGEVMFNLRNINDTAGLETRPGSLESSQFSTTTKLKGITSFANGSFGDPIADSVFTQRARLNFDTAFTSRDILTTRLSNTTGHSGNLNEEFGAWGTSSWFTTFNGEVLFQRPIDPTSFFYLGGGLTGTFFDTEIPTKQDRDKQAHGLDLNCGGTFGFADRWSFSTRNDLSYGDFGGFGKTIRTGVLDNPLTTFRSENYLSCDLGGVSATTGLRYNKFNESSCEDYDSNDRSVLLEFAYPQGRRAPTFYLSGVAGSRTYDNGFWDLDSSYTQCNVGARGFFPCGVYYDLLFGWESWDYDDSYLDEDDNPRFEASIFGSPTQDLLVAFFLSYGVQHVFPNYGGVNFANPMGWMISTRVQRSLGQLGDVGLFAEQSILDTQFDQVFPESRHERFNVGFYYDYPLRNLFPSCENVTITPRLMFTQINGGLLREDFLSGSITSTLRF